MKTIEYKKIVNLTFAALILSYFLYHLIKGNRGILAYYKLTAQLNKESSKLNALTEQRVDLEHKITLISAKTLNKDFLEELTRKNLSLARANEEIVIPND
jgi:cell division protein FtsB